MLKELFESLSQVQFYVLIVLLAAVIIQLLYFLFFHFRLVLYKPKTNLTSQPAVSIVICAKNEADNLLENIPLIMDQAYPKFELIVVNDSSWDETEDVLKAFDTKYSNLKVLRLNEDVHRMVGKKFALTLGIKSAIYENILLTDADCRPLSANWITHMVNSLSKSNELVLGVSLLKKGKGIFKKLFRFESVHTASSYLSFSLAKMPYMGVGRNMLYSKELFFSVGGFRSHMHIPGGDDDLFVNEVAKKAITSIKIVPECQTTSESADGFKNWFRQKKRHLYASGYYKVGHKFLLSLEPMTWWLMWMSFVALLILHTPILLLIVPLALRYVVVYGNFIAIGRKLNALDSVWLMPVWELALNVLKPLIMVSNMIAKPKKWM